MLTYLALSIVAPHGENIANGRKTLEVRRWRPTQLPLHDLLIVENAVFLNHEGQTDPAGKAVALVDVVDVHEWKPTEMEQACSSGWLPGYWAWQLTNIRPIDYPLKVRAERKLYSIIIDEQLLRSTLKKHDAV